MIYAKTDIERMPENCCECPKRLEWGRVDSTYCDLMNKRHTHVMGRPEWCPLVVVDETMPEQLATAKADVAAAEARCAKMARILESEDVW